MTEQEAIEVLKDFNKQVSAKADGAYQSTIGEMACKIAISALEKQVAETPLQLKGDIFALTIDGKAGDGVIYACPACSSTELSRGYPCKCGKKLDWSEI